MSNVTICQYNIKHYLDLTPFVDDPPTMDHRTIFTSDLSSYAFGPPPEFRTHVVDCPLTLRLLSFDAPSGISKPLIVLLGFFAVDTGDT